MFALKKTPLKVAKKSWQNTLTLLGTFLILNSLSEGAKGGPCLNSGLPKSL